MGAALDFHTLGEIRKREPDGEQFKTWYKNKGKKIGRKKKEKKEEKEEKRQQEERMKEK